MTPNECKLNFIVPSDTILEREGNKFQVDAQQPGILTSVITSFAQSYTKPEVKLAFDGKKIANGFGNKLGEEDLGGHEEKHTLRERE